MMDDDFGFDDTVGKKEIELDGLLLNEKLTAKIGFNEVKCTQALMNICFTLVFRASIYRVILRNPAWILKFKISF